jgi:hypothetical protein
MSHSRKSRTTEDPDAFLATYPAPIAKLAQSLRPLVRSAAPDATERVYPGWKALGYRDAHAGYFCGIFPQSDHVRLLFEHGAALAASGHDPAGLLEGDARQVRYVVLRPGERVPAAAITALLASALRYGSRLI